MKNVFKVMLILATVYCTQSFAGEIAIKPFGGQTFTVKIDTDSTNTMLYQAVSDKTGIPVDKIKLLFNSGAIPQNDSIIDPTLTRYILGMYIIRSKSEPTIMTDAPTTMTAAEKESKELLFKIDKQIVSLEKQIAKSDSKIAELEAVLLAERMLRDTKLAELDVARLEEARLS